MLTDTLGQLIAGGLAVPVCQFLKKALRLEGTRMLWAAVLVSFGLALATSWLSGAAGLLELLKNPQMLLSGTGVIFATAQVVFRGIKDKMQLGLPSDTPAGS